jgi:hypothetical protein
VIELRVARSSIERPSESIEGRYGGLPKSLGGPSAHPFTGLFIKTIR